MKKTKRTEQDKFIQIAVGGGKKLTGEVKRMAEIPPLPIQRKTLEKGTAQVALRTEKTEAELYAEFLAEKEALKRRYRPFLANYAKEIPCEGRELKEFDYRRETEADKKNFSLVLNGEGEWEKLSLPHYVGPDGRWNAFYRAVLPIENLQDGKRFVLDFEAVDYIAEVYVNGRVVCRHEGLFGAFSTDITEYISEGENVLLIVVKNDFTSTGVTVEGACVYGDKIYGATHLGYDEPNLGWHHCPAGAGIHGKVTLCVCNAQRVTDIFVRPNIESGEITVCTTVCSYAFPIKKLKAYYTVEGRNFRAEICKDVEGKTDPFHFGTNYLTHTVKMGEYRLWTQDEPYLYAVTVRLEDENGVTVNEKQTHFGMRSFTMDENSSPRKGAFYFNGKRIMLRGTNEMGHLPRCVMEKDYEQLFDDIMTAKVAGLNFYRVTQRPVFQEIYDYFDMTGMLCQSDFPLFSYLKPSSLGEALKQVDEMARHTRNHPSVILETFCNETLDKTAWGKEQYVLSRFDMEKFFDAARQVVEINNPDRVIKYCEGDYAPLEKSYGISDFHCYTYWYVSHGMPSGKLRKGYLPPIRPDWMTGCGEFGVDGLDRLELMKKYCPKDWLPESDGAPWSPKPIAKEQCFVLHGDFFPEQNTAEEWIAASRAWQKEAIKNYVHILRLRSDYIESTAVHLLIDAWPCGWTKTLVDVDRIPKPAYYAFKEANIPLRVSLRRDQFVVYDAQTPTVEVYAFNDLPDGLPVTANVSVYLGEECVENYTVDGVANGAATTYLGEIKLRIPRGYTGDIRVCAAMVSEKGETYDEAVFTAKAPNQKAKKTPKICSEELACVTAVCEGETDENILFVSAEDYAARQAEFEQKAFDGCKVYVALDRPINVLGEQLSFRVHPLEEEVRANNLVFRNAENPYVAEFAEMDFQNFYNAEKDYQDLTAWFKFDWKDAEEILYTLEDSNDPKYALHKRHKLIAAEKKHGKGSIILSTLSALDGCIGNNPVLDKFFINVIEK